MTLENYGFLGELDHCYPLSKTNLSNENDMYKSTDWSNLRPMYCSEIISTKPKLDHRLYLMQEIKANYFKQSKEERINEKLHWRDIFQTS